MRTARSRPRGFTLIEMIVVVAIVGILATAAQPLLTLTARRQKEFALRQSLRSLRVAIDNYHQAVLDGTVEKPAVPAAGYPPSLMSLVEGVPDASAAHRKRYFLRRMPRDPFAEPGTPAAQTWGLRSYDSSAEAPTPGADVYDVYSRAEGTGLDGRPYRDW